MRFKIAKGAASISRFILQSVLMRPGAFYPGKIALNIDNNIICDLSNIFDKGSALVTGTNGKTSVTSLMAQCAKYFGMEVSTNNTGANLASGVASAMLDFKPTRNTNRFGVYEVDELWVEKVLPQTKSKYLLLLNLFPDQVDRFGDIKNIQKSLLKALKTSPETTLIYNCDDPNCQLIADCCENNTISFGVDEKISSNEYKQKNNCPICFGVLKYKLHQYDVLGKYKCSNCGFNRADAIYAASDISMTNNKLQFSVCNKEYVSKKTVEYAVYNLTGFIALADMLNCHYDSISKAIYNQKVQKGRMEYFDIDNKRVMINLAKNPVGFNQNINYIANKILDNSNKEPISVAFFVNAREGDGRSTNWLNDVNFEKLSNIDLIDFFYGGEAYQDLSCALKNADILAHRVNSAKDVLDFNKINKKVFIIANYTAMFPLRDELSNL